MKILLSSSSNQKNELTSLYGRAIKTSKDLYIASAFLTNWSTQYKLCPQCQKFVFLIGTDFGLTRKEACKSVLNWLPKKFKSDFLAVPSKSLGNFHPKVIAWQDLDNYYHCIIGSSNLTEAAFNSNIEANVKLEISKKEFERIVTWIENTARDCQVVNDDWLAQYKERKFVRPEKTNSREVSGVIKLSIPSASKYHKAIIARRKRERTFKEINSRLLSAIRSCANGSISNREFWEKFKKLWWQHTSRIQGSGLQYSAKSANWKQACKSMRHILNRARTESEVNLDRVVREQIDFLAEANNPVRGAWFSEILCHYFPNHYPLINQPINKWLKLKRWKAQRGSSEGSAYIELARKLREVIRQNKGGPRNLVELDAVIWSAVED